MSSACVFLYIIAAWAFSLRLGSGDLVNIGRPVPKFTIFEPVSPLRLIAEDDLTCHISPCISLH